MTTRRGLLASAGAALSLPWAGSLRAQGASTLTVAIFADPLTFDPHLTGNLQGRGACRAIHDTLFEIDANGRLAPGLCESWERPDDRTFLLKLRRGVRFHDGTEFDAEAVRFNIARIFDREIGSIRPGEISALDRTEVVDSHTLRLTLKYPFAAFLFPFTDVTGCIGSPAAMRQHGRDYGLRPSGTGPYRLVEYLKDARTVLEKNGSYWQQGRPLLDRVILRPIPVDSTRLAELRSGGVQIAEALPLQDIRRLRTGRDLVVSERVGFRWEYFGFNLRDIHPSRSKAFRQAFQWGIDREALHQVAYFGTGAIGFDGILPGSPFHDADYKPFRRDVERAKRLIGESGISVPVSMVGPLQPDPVKQRAAQVFQANAAEIGMQLRIEQLDSAGYRSALQSGQLPIDLQGWWGYRPDPDQYLFILLHSTGSYARFHGYANPRMDELLMQQRASTDEAQRRRIFREISALMNEDAVYVPWHYSSDFKGLHPRVRNFVHAPDGIIDYRPITLV
jgi:peptide/nickel transport system substrate-binding protein